MNLDWQIGPFEAFTALSGKEDVIHHIHWRVIGTETVDGSDGSSSTYSATTYGCAQFDVEALDLTNFTPHSDLTKGQVIGWLTGGLIDMTSITHSLTSQIEGQKRPVKKSLVPSWINIPMTAPAPTPPPTTTLGG